MRTYASEIEADRAGMLRAIGENHYKVECLRDLVKASEGVIGELKALQALLNSDDPFIREHTEQKAWAFVENNTAIKRLCEMITRSNLYLNA